MATKTEAVGTGRIEYVDPNQLTIALNVRTDTKVDPDFVDSIKQVGILNPPMVTANEEGGYDVVLGQRRTLGAIKAGLTTMPVYVVGKLEADAARIIDQLTENDQREPLSEAERLGGFRQLSLFGMKPADMVRRTARPKAEVDRYLKVLSSNAATQAVADLPITLEDAEALAEFDKDPAAQKKLLKAAGTGQFKWEIQAARRKRDVGVKVEAARAKLEKAGVKILATQPAYKNRLDSWAAPEDPHTALTEKDHAKCPGHAATIGNSEYNAGNVDYWCEDPEFNGHVAKKWGTPETPEEREATEARAAAAAKVKADDDAARSIRRSFIAEKLTSSKQPADLALVFPRALLLLELYVDGVDLDALALLDLPAEGDPDPDDVFAALQKTPRLAAAFPAAMALAHLESCVTALRPDGYYDEQRDFAAREYFTLLQSWGYERTEHEQLLLDARAAHDAARAAAEGAPVDDETADGDEDEEPLDDDQADDGDPES